MRHVVDKKFIYEINYSSGQPKINFSVVTLKLKPNSSLSADTRKINTGTLQTAKTTDGREKMPPYQRRKLIVKAGAT